jgi:hypothetical protein
MKHLKENPLYERTKQQSIDIAEQMYQDIVDNNVINTFGSITLKTTDGTGFLFNFLNTVCTTAPLASR